MLDAGEPNKPGAAGKPNRHEFDVRLVDDDDVEVATGEVGEIVCRPKGPNLMFAGYWNRPDSTVEATRNLWFHTGDLGRVDDDGYLYFVDRKKDALRRRGENISSFEMEKVLFGHDAIRDVAVHAVPSPIGEDDVKITVVLQDGAELSEEELCRWVAERVPYLRDPALRRVPRRPAPQSGRPGAEVPAPRRGRDRRDLGPRGRRRGLRPPLTRAALTKGKFPRWGDSMRACVICGSAGRDDRSWCCVRRRGRRVRRPGHAGSRGRDRSRRLRDSRRAANHLGGATADRARRRGRCLRRDRRVASPPRQLAVGTRTAEALVAGQYSIYRNRTFAVHLPKGFEQNSGQFLILGRIVDDAVCFRPGQVRACRSHHRKHRATHARGVAASGG